MASQMVGNSGPMRVTPNGVLDEVEALSAAESKMLFALDHWNQSRGQDSTFAGPARTIAAGSAPAMTNVAREDTKEVPNTETSAEVQHDKAFIFCSGKVVDKSGEAHHRLSTVDAVPRETGTSFETADFALGESLSEADSKTQDKTVSPSALIVKFSTTSPGRINRIERRGPARTYEQTRSPRAGGRKDASQRANNPATPLASGQKRRGRPLGSKNKQHLKRPQADGSNMSREIHPAPPRFGREARKDVFLAKGRSPTQSEVMKAIWAKRRSNGTDGHRGRPSNERTILKREPKIGLSGLENGAPLGKSNRNYPNQVLDGHHKVRSISAATLPALAPRPADSVRQTAEHGIANRSHSQKALQAPIAGLPSRKELPALCIGDAALAEVFGAYIYPSLVKSKSRHQGVLSNVTLDVICKQVANHTVDKRFKDFLKEYDYRLDKIQRKRIRKYIKKLYASKVRHARERDQSEPLLRPNHEQPQISGVTVAAPAHTVEVQATTDLSRDSKRHEDVALNRVYGLERPGMVKNVPPLSVAEDGRRASTGGTASFPEIVQANPDTDGLSSRLKPLSLRACIACRSSKRKCHLRGTSCVSCEIAGKTCSFSPGDLDGNLIPIQSGAVVQNEFVVKRRASEPAIIRRCILCRQKHIKCVPQGANCIACEKAGRSCTFRQGDLEQILKRSSNPRLPSAAEQRPFTGYITPQGVRSTLQDDSGHRYGNPPNALHNDDHDERMPRSTRSEDQSAHSFDRGYSCLQSASPKATSGDSFLQPSTRGPSSGQPNKPSRLALTTRKKVVDVNTQIDRNHPRGIDWYHTLYICPTSPQTRVNTTLQNIQGEPSAYPLSQIEPSRSQSSSAPVLAKPPTAFHPELELALAKATLCHAAGDRPYKSQKRGHYDFVREELTALLIVLDSLDEKAHQEYTADTIELRRQLKARLEKDIDSSGKFPQERMTAIVQAAHSAPGTALAHRKKKNVRAFLLDLIGHSVPISAQPRLGKPSLEVVDLKPRSTISPLLRYRELGLDRPERHINLQTAIGTHVAEDIRPWRSWKGASSDVVTVAWAPNSLSYAAGAAAQSDDNDLQYNRPRNLLFGDLVSNTICELPDHSIDRPKPEAVASGPNSTYAVYQACDPIVYKTVTSVHFAPSGALLYTASHDNTVKIWDATAEQRPTCWATLRHQAEVTSLEVSNYYPSHFATASKVIDNSVRVYQPTQQGSAYEALNFSSSRAVTHRGHDIFPECIRWGLAPGTKHLLLGGFQQWADHDFSAARQGQICLWDLNTGASINVRPHASAIFSVAWHPREDIFLTGGAPGNGLLSYPQTTKSVVRSYDMRSTSTYTHEFECPALDMQDVTFHPNSSTYVTAGCTDGTTYVWDYRWPDDIMHELHHGKPLQELVANEEGLPYFEHREKVDAGVMLSIWGKEASLFYTGSSDGVIKAWDILRAPEDVWIKDVARLPAGIQSGALSPDGMNMIVGDAVGGVHILSAAPFGSTSTDDDGVSGYNPDPINFRYADTKEEDPDTEDPGTQGIDSANELLKSGQLILHPSFGAGKGPNYQGPFAGSARWQNPNSGYNELLPRFDSQQAFLACGVEQAHQADKIKALVAARREHLQAEKQEVKPLVFSCGPPPRFVAGRPAHSTSSARRTSQPPVTKPARSPHRNRPSDPRPRTPTSTTFPAPNPKPTTLNPDHDHDLVYISTSPLKRKFPHHADHPPSTPPSSKRLKTEIITPSKSQSRHPQFSRGNVEVEVVDLTGEGEGEEKSALELRMKELRAMIVEREKGGLRKQREGMGTVVLDLEDEEGRKGGEDEEEEGNPLSWEEWIGEDWWWPEGC